MTTTHSLLLACTPAGVAGIFGSTAFLTCSGQLTSGLTTEARVATPAKSALTLANLAINISVGNASTQTIRDRANVANGNEVISITGSGTGWFSDSTHTTSVSAGQLYCVSWNTPGNGATATVILLDCQNTSPLVSWNANSGSSQSWNSTVRNSFPFGSFTSAAAGESYFQSVVRAAGTWQGLAFTELAAATATITYKSRKGGSDGNQVVSQVNPAANTTYQDTTHSDSVVSGNNIDISDGSSATSGTWIGQYGEFAGTISAHDIGCLSTNATGGQSLSGSTQYYWPLSGALAATTAEAGTKARVPYALTFSRLRANIITNSAATITITSRDNGAPGNQTISVGSGTTGEVEDTTHSDSIVSGHDINTAGLSGTITTLAIRDVRALLDDGSVAAFNTETGTGILAFSGISFSGSGADSHTGTGALAFSGISFVGSGTRKETGTGALAFSGIAFAGTGARTETASGALHFSGLSFSGSGRDSHSGVGVMSFAGISFTAHGVAEHTGTGALHFSGFAIVASGTGIAAPAPPNPSPVQLNTLRRVDPLKWNVAIVDKNGLPLPEFQRKWQQQHTQINEQAVPQDYVDGQVASNLAAAKTYTVLYGSTVLTAAKAYSDTHLAPTGVYTVATLPAAPVEGQTAKVTDATATTLGSVVAGGGANKVPVWFHSPNWLIG